MKKAVNPINAKLIDDIFGGKICINGKNFMRITFEFADNNNKTIDTDDSLLFRNFCIEQLLDKRDISRITFDRYSSATYDVKEGGQQ